MYYNVEKSCKILHQCVVFCFSYFVFVFKIKRRNVCQLKQLWNEGGSWFVGMLEWFLCHWHAPCPSEGHFCLLNIDLSVTLEDSPNSWQTSCLSADVCCGNLCYGNLLRWWGDNFLAVIFKRRKSQLKYTSVALSRGGGGIGGSLVYTQWLIQEIVTAGVPRWWKTAGAFEGFGTPQWYL